MAKWSCAPIAMTPPETSSPSPDPDFGFSTGTPNGDGVTHTLIAEEPAANGLWLSRTYAFAPEDPDAPEALAVTLALTPASARRSPWKSTSCARPN